MPPFLGSRVVKGISLDDIAAYLNETALFRHQWGFRPEKGENDDDFKARIRPVFREELAKVKAEGVLVPQVVYGYFAANGDGNDVVIWKDDTRTAEWMRFAFPRQQKAPYLCIADFFRPIDSGETDYAAFTIVTMGGEVTESANRLRAEDRYQDYLVRHGIGVEMAEALAEHWHHRIREEWGFADEDGNLVNMLLRQHYRGGRYSWGYPACPDLEDNAKVAELLEADRIGVVVSETTSSTTPSRPPPPSSATTPRPSTSSSSSPGPRNGGRLVWTSRVSGGPRGAAVVVGIDGRRRGRDGQLLEVGVGVEHGLVQTGRTLAARLALGSAPARAAAARRRVAAAALPRPASFVAGTLPGRRRTSRRAPLGLVEEAGEGSRKPSSAIALASPSFASSWTPPDPEGGGLEQVELHGGRVSAVVLLPRVRACMIGEGLNRPAPPGPPGRCRSR